ncbi:Hypothetical protein FKW44_001278, partial [Caligus rogercresseyi]
AKPIDRTPGKGPDVIPPPKHKLKRTPIKPDPEKIQPLEDPNPKNDGLFEWEDDFFKDDKYFEEVSRNLRADAGLIAQQGFEEPPPEPGPSRQTGGLTLTKEHFDEEDEGTTLNDSNSRAYYGSESETETIDPVLHTMIDGDRLQIRMVSDTNNYNPWCPQIEAAITDILNFFPGKFTLTKKENEVKFFVERSNPNPL